MQNWWITLLYDQMVLPSDCLSLWYAFMMDQIPNNEKLSTTLIFECLWRSYFGIGPFIIVMIVECLHFNLINPSLTNSYGVVHVVLDLGRWYGLFMVLFLTNMQVQEAFGVQNMKIYSSCCLSNTLRLCTTHRPGFPVWNFVGNSLRPTLDIFNHCESGDTSHIPGTVNKDSSSNFWLNYNTSFNESRDFVTQN